MDCNQTKEEFRKTHFTVEEDLISTSVKIAMECLQISSRSSSPTANTNHCSDPQFGGDYKTEQQNDRQTNQMIDERADTYSAVKQSSDQSSGSVDVPKDLTNEGICEPMEGYASDSIYDSSSETEIADKNERSDQTCEVNEEKNSSLNTVVESKGRPLTKYPLKFKWQLWFWRADPGVKVIWEKALQRVCKPFDTVEDFWRLYHHIIPVRQLVPPSDYCVFKEGISPMWEDSHNINGGKWTLDFAKGENRAINPHLDEIWLEVLLCLIGEGFNEFGEDICGAVVNIRSKTDRISVWTANGNNSVSNLKIGEILKIRSRYEGKMKYEAHTTSQRIAEAKDRLFDTRYPNNLSKEKTKTMRRSCAF